MEGLIKKSDRWLSKRSLGGSFAAACAFAALSSHAGATTLSDDPAVIRAEFQKYAETETLPRKVDDITTLTAVHFDGRLLTHSYEISADATETNLAQENAVKLICDGEGRLAVTKGFAFRFDYQRAGTKIASYDVASCPAKAAAETPIGSLAYSYDIVGSRIIIHAKGDISAKEGEALSAWWSALPPHAANYMRVGHITLALNSPGGMIDGAAGLAEWVEANKVDTVVANGSTCASACVAIWAPAGTRRLASTRRSASIARPPPLPWPTRSGSRRRPWAPSS